MIPSLPHILRTAGSSSFRMYLSGEMPPKTALMSTSRVSRDERIVDALDALDENVFGLEEGVVMEMASLREQ